jgi:hypothetical protein
MANSESDSSASDREQWRVVVNTAMSFRVPLKAWDFLTG